MAKIDAFFKLMNEQGASDLHMVSGSQPILRIRGDMERIKYKELGNEELKVMLYEIAHVDYTPEGALGRGCMDGRLLFAGGAAYDPRGWSRCHSEQLIHTMRDQSQHRLYGLTLTRSHSGRSGVV